MLTYEQRLAEFAHGKRLLRLPRPVRDRADAFCDACGSSQPRTLYTLKDLESERYYFVGDTCLKQLAKSGAVLRRYGRESGQKAYESEMELRTRELEEAPTKAEDPEPPATSTHGLVLGQKWRRRSGTRCVSGSTNPAMANFA